MTELSMDYLLLLIKIYQRLTALQKTLILNYANNQPEEQINVLRNEIRQLEILLE